MTRSLPSETVPPERKSGPVRIGLLWHSQRAGNLGVGALTESNLAILNGVAQKLGVAVEYHIIGMSDPGPLYRGSTACREFRITGKSIILLSGLWRYLGGLDVVFDIGGGDSFTDIYGPKRFFFMWYSKLLTILRGVPLILSPQTIGPFNHRLARTLAAAVMKRSSCIVARDLPSTDLANALARGAKVVESIDVAFRLPFTREAHEPRSRLKVALNVSGMLWHEARSGRNRFGLNFDYAELTCKFIEYCLGQPGIALTLFPHVDAGDAANPDNDLRALKELAARYPAVEAAAMFDSPSHAKSFLSGFDLVVAARMHACIAAFSAGVPVVPVAYSRKFSGLFAQVDYSWVLTERTPLDAALQKLIDATRATDDMKAQITSGMAKVSRLVGNYEAVAAGALARAAGCELGKELVGHG